MMGYSYSAAVCLLQLQQYPNCSSYVYYSTYMEIKVQNKYNPAVELRATLLNYLSLDWMLFSIGVEISNEKQQEF